MKASKMGKFIVVEKHKGKEMKVFGIYPDKESMEKSVGENATIEQLEHLTPYKRVDRL